MRPSDGVTRVHYRTDTPSGKRIRWGAGDVRPRELVYRARLTGAGPLVICEGEKAADAVAALGCDALGVVTGAPAVPDAAALTDATDRDVILWPDADAVGRLLMGAVADLLPGCRTVDPARLTPDPPAGWDAADWLPTIDPLAAIDGAAPVAPSAWRKAADMTDLTPVPWLWHKRLAPGELTLMSGDPGSGKSIIAVTLAALVTTGGDFPDGSECERPGAVAWIGHAGEDSAERATVPRFLAAGGDPERLDLLDTRGDTLDLAAACASAAATIRPALAVIDSWAAWNEGTDDNDGGAVRARLAALQPLRDAGAAVLVIAHDRKAEADNAIHRAAGSVQLTAAPRMALRVSDGAVKQSKGNLGGYGPDLGFTIAGASIEVGEHTIETARVEWLPDGPTDSPTEPGGAGGGGHPTGRAGADVLFDTVVGYVMASAEPLTQNQVGHGIGAHSQAKRQAVARHLGAAVSRGDLTRVDVRRSGRSRTAYQPSAVAPVAPVAEPATGAQAGAPVAPVAPIRGTGERRLLDAGAPDGDPGAGATAAARLSREALDRVRRNCGEVYKSGAADSLRAGGLLVSGAAVKPEGGAVKDCPTCFGTGQTATGAPCPCRGKGGKMANGTATALQPWQEALLDAPDWAVWDGGKLVAQRSLTPAERGRQRAIMIEDAPYRERRERLARVPTVLH